MIKTLTIAVALAGTVVLAAPASAAPLSASAGSAAFSEAGKDLVQNVQYRRYGYYGPRYGYGYRGGWRGPAVGAGVAAGILGGALAAGALAAPAYPPPAPVYAAPDADAIAYCSRRFRSYDPETGTYIGSGGVVRACP
ncbi:BA14K family protein [Bosea sp. BK604]|uniref:BA14K family protein n=1 Tax=Bosea sp. BK604 TaxID=2512180 RepID=UPI001045B656|nr:BA14K family protein [Bosea sp. BK604]TCR62273.1 BA14K-like protein [Bosea sp. BK604]